MLWLTRKKIRKLLDTGRIERAIVIAERQTSGEIRVSLAPWFWGNVERAAERAFVRLGMNKTQHRNGVLFFVVPSRRAFVVLGDGGVHARVGQEFWEEIASSLSDHFRRGDFTSGLVAGVTRAGEQLAEHFPYDHEHARNELPDEVDIARLSSS
ncbi:MAG: TPM domain-containing protein [Myxococcales bacterium]|nr:TPM domain-containing protein [Myxococcales bacterium]